MSTVTAPPIAVDDNRPGIPLSRLIRVEIRKMFDTRSGFWLMASILIIAALATLSVIAFVKAEDLEYGVFGAALGVPMSILLPVVAILSVTGEWSQRAGLTTFTLVPNRAAIVWAKFLAALIVGTVAMVLVLGVGAIGNIVGTSIRGADIVWATDAEDLALIVLVNVIGMMTGFMLGVLIRNSAAAIVGYFVYSLVLPTIFAVLAELQDWFADLQPWIDFNDAQTPLFDGGADGQEWAQIATSGMIWLVIPTLVGVWLVMRSEVK